MDCVNAERKEGARPTFKVTVCIRFTAPPVSFPVSDKTPLMLGMWLHALQPLTINFPTVNPNPPLSTASDPVSAVLTMLNPCSLWQTFQIFDGRNHASQKHFLCYFLFVCRIQHSPLSTQQISCSNSTCTGPASVPSEGKHLWIKASFQWASSMLASRY